ncbi:MAG TPA: rod shape-determining protein RodA [Candidatus Limnocylindrales bacterium]|nr:rod shape-determining protein RodA [Candidatus Limnocylindrales bacterium]
MSRLDRVQPPLAVLLAALGVMTVYSAGADWTRQIVWVILGGAVYAAMAAYDYRRLRALAPALYVVMLVALAAVHLVGHSALGARRWLSVAGFPLEPSELAKLLLLVVLAAYLSRGAQVSWRSFAGGLGLVAAPAALVLTQPDLGTTLVLVAVAGGTLFLAGARPAQLATIVTAGVVAVPLLPHLLHGYQRRRLEIFLDPSQDPLGAGYNLLQARIAVGSGGLFGQGWLHGLQGQLGFVPERATDFVFASFAEEFGLLGSLVLLVLFGTLLLRLLRSATQASDRFGELLCGGVFCMVLVQVVENVGMNVGLLPIAGIPLPLISYGGSATITTLAALGLVQSVTLRRKTVTYKENDPLRRLRHHLPTGGEDALGTITRRAQA